ncbi:MAG: nucleoside triphosphate pyrophosphohydrolase [Thermotogae bacterium]|nr:nucleoside triphosphate pyrophosphohydrolase [Thermotogota bacterium]
MSKGIDKLLRIMKRLRAENGCKWDREQTHKTLKPYVVEEAFEVVDAIESGDDEKLREELGDLLLQVIFHAEIAEEEKKYTFDDVCKTLSDKLIFRHPHVFGNIHDENFPYTSWEKTKSKNEKAVSKTLGNVNHALPGLTSAHRIQENAGRVGFDWTNVDDVLKKVEEELYEIKEEIKSKSKERYEDEIGDLLFAVVNLSRFLSVDPEKAVRKATERFIMRFSYIEKKLEERGLSVIDQPLSVLNSLWEEAKIVERGEH